MQVKVDCDSEFETDYFIDEEVSKSDTEADKDIDEYQTTMSRMGLILLLKKRRVSLKMSLLLVLQRSKKKSKIIIP